jgi:hypothetical protein
MPFPPRKASVQTEKRESFPSDTGIMRCRAFTVSNPNQIDQTYQYFPHTVATAGLTSDPFFDRVTRSTLGAKPLRHGQLFRGDGQGCRRHQIELGY